MKPKEEHLYLPTHPKEISREKIQQLLEIEKKYYLNKTVKSKENTGIPTPSQ
jgi:hypothetical protein